MYAHYTGVVDITPELGAILSGKEDAKSTDFGNSCESQSLPTPRMFFLGIVQQRSITDPGTFSRPFHL